MNMRKKNIFTLLLALAVSTGMYASNHYKNNRQPLLQKDYIELPLGSITIGVPTIFLRVQFY